MQQIGGTGFGNMLTAYSGIVGLKPPYIVCHGDIA